jgi:hypothetical protein
LCGFAANLHRLALSVALFVLHESAVVESNHLATREPTEQSTGAVRIDDGQFVQIDRRAETGPHRPPQPFPPALPAGTTFQSISVRIREGNSRTWPST